jgi:hypothetical protein
MIMFLSLEFGNEIGTKENQQINLNSQYDLFENDSNIKI